MFELDPSVDMSPSFFLMRVNSDADQIQTVSVMTVEMITADRFSGNDSIIQIREAQ